MLKAKTAVKRVVLGIEPREISVDIRGFRPVDAAAAGRLEVIGRAFVHGYDCALVARDADDLVASLSLVATELLGFAYEGAAMATTLLDQLSLRRSTRWADLLEAGGEPHIYMLHVGAGWAFARLPRGTRRLEAHLASSDPLLGWLAVDGYGFHHGFFGSTRALAGWRPRFTRPYGARAFDQGLGRSLWFVEGTGTEGVARRIASFDRDRRSDLWSGLGLACAYAGIASAAQLERLGTLAGADLPHLRQGVAFAAAARARAGHVAEHTEQTCQVLCGRSAAELADLTEDVRNDLGAAPTSHDYERWRQKLASHVATSRALF
jgi:hypothetical protein